MRRKRLEKRIAQIARANGLTTQWEEGANHSKVTVGKALAMVPRHREINEHTAQGIIRYIERNCK
ncbi:hypothetical protein KIMH_01780 [Bombiscardovia apis]|uniref:Toxin HicA n=1 Tax=Bombiscardovia apis TaxID=2932182 RepID=A0ABN6SFL3_9BIFI|nr:hypothetical protein KIMH_01780 [Bombiscardovia apis]